MSFSAQNSSLAFILGLAEKGCNSRLAIALPPLARVSPKLSYTNRCPFCSWRIRYFLPMFSARMTVGMVDITRSHAPAWECLHRRSSVGRLTAGAGSSRVPTLEHGNQNTAAWLMPCRRWLAFRPGCHTRTAAPFVRGGSGISCLGFQHG